MILLAALLLQAAAPGDFVREESNEQRHFRYARPARSHAGETCRSVHRARKLTAQADNSDGAIRFVRGPEVDEHA